MGRQVNVEKIAKMKELYAQVGSVGVVAKHMGCTAVNVWLTLKRHGIKIQNPRKRRNPEEIRKIVNLYNETGSLAEVAKNLKCTQANVSYLLKRNGYKIINSCSKSQQQFNAGISHKVLDKREIPWYNSNVKGKYCEQSAQ